MQRAVDEAIPENASNRTNNSSPDVEMIQEIRHTDKKFETHNIDDSGDDDSIVMDDGDGQVCVNYISKPVNYFVFQNDFRQAMLAMSKPSTSNNHVGPVRVTVMLDIPQSITLDVPSEWTVLDLKKKIHSRTNIPVCRQALTGWPGATPRDKDKLSKFNCFELKIRVHDTTTDGTSVT